MTHDDRITGAGGGAEDVGDGGVFGVRCDFDGYRKGGGMLLSEPSRLAGISPPNHYLREPANQRNRLQVRFRLLAIPQDAERLRVVASQEVGGDGTRGSSAQGRDGASIYDG